MKIKEVVETVVSYPKLAERLEANPGEKDRVKKLVKEIAGDFNPDVVRSYVKLVDATFAKLYDGVSFDVPENFDLKALSEDNHIILVPNHQSHADYIALTYVIFGVYSLPVYIAGGINLNVFPIGGMFRKGGAFFIRRKFNNDILYKLTFEAYCYYLLKNNLLIEFFFEGGRSRTGKLLSPRYGLFQMLLEAHAQLDDGKPLMFVPVTLAHEQVPESSAHAKELWGAKKKKESTSQLLKIFKIFKRKLGTIHVRFSSGIKVNEYTDLKETTRRLAFDCFRAIGNAMPITPMSLTSLILMDEPSGTLTCDAIIHRGKEIIDYCNHASIPITYSLSEEKYEDSLRRALEILEDNGKIETIYRENLDKTFYSIIPKFRTELLYFKNMIIHHFLVPAIMNGAWTRMLNGTVKSVADLNKYFMTQRKELKFEFYLPTIKELLHMALQTLGFALGRNVSSLDECLEFSEQELNKVAKTIGLFSTTFVYINESYYLGASALEFINDNEFDKKKFLSVSKELFELEREHGRIVKYYESYTVPMLNNCLNFFINQNAVSCEEGVCKVIDHEKVQFFKEKFSRDINDQVSMYLRVKDMT
jgi:glycerol-3-phosphate O-acyltransferase